MTTNNLPATHINQNIDWDKFQRYVTLQLHQAHKQYDGTTVIEISKFLGLQYKNTCFYNPKTGITTSQESSQELIKNIQE